jgi:hypothetical protein
MWRIPAVNFSHQHCGSIFFGESQLGIIQLNPLNDSQEQE